MAEAIEKRPLPPDFPDPLAGSKGRVNIRKAMAGIYALQGEGSMYRCAVKAGFSRSTARRLLANGITAERCIEEAAKLDPELGPAKLLEGGRRRLAEQIAFMDPRTVPLRDVVRMFEATEKYFGGHELSPTNTLVTVADRLSQVAALLAVAQRRGLPVPRVDTPYLDAEVVATSAEKVQAPRSVNSATPDGTTR